MTLTPQLMYKYISYDIGTYSESARQKSLILHQFGKISFQYKAKHYKCSSFMRKLCIKLRTREGLAIIEKHHILHVFYSITILVKSN